MNTCHQKYEEMKSMVPIEDHLIEDERKDI
jgi:hypothetical protein